MRQIEIECYFIFNDKNKDAIELLKSNVAPLHAEIKENNKLLHINIGYYNNEFHEIYPEIKNKLLSARYQNVIFNLDQCGYVHVSKDIIRDVITSWKSPEVFLTFLISPLLRHLSANPDKDNTLAKFPEIRDDIFSIIKNPEEPISKKDFIGKAEKVVFEYLKKDASYVSPFAIKNPDGCLYWFMHFAKSYRARQVYNDILHENSTYQAHFGRSGLSMLSYNPDDEVSLYLFDNDSRKLAKEQLHDDIPKLISEHGDALLLKIFTVLHITKQQHIVTTSTK